MGYIKNKTKEQFLIDSTVQLEKIVDDLTVIKRSYIAQKLEQLKTRTIRPLIKKH